jgi:hypothetical protein
MLKHWEDKDGFYWFQNPDPLGPAMGPYVSKREMLEDKAGIERTTRTKAWQEVMRGDVPNATN